MPRALLAGAPRLTCSPLHHDTVQQAACLLLCALPAPAEDLPLAPALILEAFMPSGRTETVTGVGFDSSNRTL